METANLEQNVDYCVCKWNHEDCFALSSRHPGTCRILFDCDFQSRNDCPFYKPNQKNDESLNHKETAF